MSFGNGLINRFPLSSIWTSNAVRIVEIYCRAIKRNQGKTIIQNIVGNGHL